MKQLTLLLSTLLLLFILACVISQDIETPTEEMQLVHDHESLKALEYDADVAELKDAAFLSEYLTGNILIGIWAKSNTRQYFAPSGTTWYQEEDNPQSHGTWRVRDDGKYCSIWPPSRVESCYTVSFMDDVLFWHSGRNRYPSALQIIEKEEETEVDDSETDSESN